MARTVSAARKIFLRYILNNVLLIVLPFVIAVVYYGISIQVITDGVDNLTTRQLRQSVESVDSLFVELNTMAAQLGNDYDVNFYLGNDGPYTDIEYYNLKRVSRKLAPYVFGSPVLGHVYLYMPRSDTLVWENGFGRYQTLYGSHFSVKGRSAEVWRDSILQVPASGQFLPSEQIAVGRDQVSGHLYLRNIGYEGALRGSIIVVLNDDGLINLLADIPQDYGGWVVVEDAGGNKITTTYPDSDDLPGTPEWTSTAEQFEHHGEKYRLYKATSAFNGWTYTAVLSETQLLSRVQSVRNIAIVLLMIGLLIGISSSYLVAFRNANPLRHIFELLIPD